MTELFEDLYNRHRDTVYKYILVSLGFNNDLADDCLQDVFELLLQKKDVVSQHPNPGGFFIITARNFIKRYKTAQYNRTKKLLPLDEKTATQVHYDDMDNVFNSLPDTNTLKATLLQRLNENEQSLYEAFYEQGCSVAETAKRLSISESNTKVRLFRLRIKVKQMVQEMFA
jgi:RNA polymerase sigma factor (sigma-70 family)